MANGELAAWNVPLHYGGHTLQHIIAKHEVVKESCGRMAHGQGSERPCAEFM
jgi:hypothetical protein